MANNNSILGRTILTHILVRRMTEYHHCENYGSDISTLILTRRMTKRFQRIYSDIFISTLILTKRMTEEVEDDETGENISTHILTKRMTAILNKIISFKIKLYIHYNILFAIFYIYNSILYPFSSPKRSYSGANDSANYCSLAFRTPRFPIPSLQIHFS